MKRREMITITGQGLGLLTLQACGGSERSAVIPSGSVAAVSTVAELRSIRPRYDGETFEVLGHTLEGIGGGAFYFDRNDTSSPDDGGSVIVGNGNRYKRILPVRPTAEMFGAQVNPKQDQSIFINRCLAAYGSCFLQGRQLYKIQYQINAIVLGTVGHGIATLDCASPTSDNKFGSNGSAVYAAGSSTTPLQGVDIQNIAVNCNGLIGADGQEGIAGFALHCCNAFYQKNCLVFKCAGYGYWDIGDYVSKKNNHSGARDYCEATDAWVGFGQLNAHDITLNGCKAYISEEALSFKPKALFYPQGGENMSLRLNNCSGTADGPCSTIFLASLSCKNVSANDCKFVNRSNDAPGTAIYFDHNNGHFDNITFRNCEIISLSAPAAHLSVGESGTEKAAIKFTDCKILGHEIGVAFSGSTGLYSFIGCNTTGITDESGVPYAYFERDSLTQMSAYVSVIGGSATAAGPNAITTTNMSPFIYANTKLTPPDFSNQPVIAVASVAALRAIKPKYDKQQFELLGHSIQGIGGGLFYYDEQDATSVDDDGSVIVSEGKRFKRVQPARPTPEMFGALVDPEGDQSIYINNCTKAYDECYLKASQTYTIHYTVNAKVLKCANGVATLNCLSPTNDNRFGSPETAVRAAGAQSLPLEGVDIQNVIVQCNRLTGSGGGVGLKGFWLHRCRNFYQRGCTVRDSGSYAFWDHDSSETGITYCSGTRDDCWAFDCSVSFEQVNVRGVILNNCHGYISDTVKPYPIECIFHPYGGESMQVIYNNCTGIADGSCPAIVLVLLKCKNVTMNDCLFINNHDGDGRVQTAVYFNNSSGDFDNFSFKNCVFISIYSPAIYLDIGEFGSTGAKIKFSDCVIEGYQVGAQINSTGGNYSFVNCDTKGECDETATPFAYYIRGALSTTTTGVINVIGGSATSVGPRATRTTNVGSQIYTSTRLSPAGLTALKIRQEHVGDGLLIWNGDHSYLNVRFPIRIADSAKVVISAMVNVTGATSGSQAASWTTTLSWASIDNTTFRLFAESEFAGRRVNYLMTEYE